MVDAEGFLEERLWVYGHTGLGEYPIVKIFQPQLISQTGEEGRTGTMRGKWLPFSQISAPGG